LESAAKICQRFDLMVAQERGIPSLEMVEDQLLAGDLPGSQILDIAGNQVRRSLKLLECLLQMPGTLQAQRARKG
jgi:hypothetical protein